MSDLYGVIDTSTPVNLLADPQGADKIAIPCEPGNGAIPAGTLMYRKETGLWAPAAAAQVVNTNQLAVLKEAVASGSAPESGKTAVAEDGLAYRAGCFIDGAVTLAASAALTDAHKVILRTQGIVFDKKEATGTFTNTVTGS